jgi:ribonuclease HI
MITNLKFQIEEDKRIEEALKEQLEEKDKIIGNLEAEIFTLRNDLEKKNMQNNSKVLDDIISSQKYHHEKLLGLTKACLIAREEGIKDIQVFGDSEIIIKNIITKTRFRNASLNKSLDRLNRVLIDFNSYKLYHVLRRSNREADQLASNGSTLMKGMLRVNNESFFQIP